MRMTEDDDVAGITREDGLGCRAGELVAVRDVDTQATDGYGSLVRQRRIVRVVDIAEHGDNACDPLERCEHRSASDVARVKDQFDAPEDLCNLRAPQPVRVGDQPDDLNARLKPRAPCRWSFRWSARR